MRTQLQLKASLKRVALVLNNTPAPPASSGPSGRRRVTKYHFGPPEGLLVNLRRPEACYRTP